jgi:N-acetylmuramate 1-kinase
MTTMSDPQTLTATLDVKERVALFLENANIVATGGRILQLTGDASDRRYYRVLPSDGESIVLAVHAGPFDYDRLPFVSVARLLERMPVPIPRILGHDAPLGILALQDLGDVTLQAHLGTEPYYSHAALYRLAVGLIATIQRRGAELESDAYPCYGIAFDVEKLMWELDFFLKYLVEGYRGATLTSAGREDLRHEFRPIVEELAAEPRVLCHRDYHSRNLMLHDGQLYVIDFQDARMGPDTYDLVSLLRDSYVDLNEIAVSELIAYFLALRGSSEPESQFRWRFDVMALQRNLKALGTFGYQTTVRNNPVYIQYIPRTLRYVRDALRRHPRFERLRALLATHIEELR